MQGSGGRGKVTSDVLDRSHVLGSGELVENVVRNHSHAHLIKGNNRLVLTAEVDDGSLAADVVVVGHGRHAHALHVRRVRPVEVLHNWDLCALHDRYLFQK